MSSEKRGTFFRFIYDGAEGYACIAVRTPGTKLFQEEFFRIPDQLPSLLTHIERFARSHDVYYCPQLFSRASRTKEACSATPTVWSDLDTCNPSKMLVPPTIVVESSPKRWQALWKVEPPFEPSDAETVSRRIAYYHSEDGADRSGWDLTQLLRVPFTMNHKYRGQVTIPQVVVESTGAVVHPEDFSVYPEAEGHEFSDIPFPTVLPKKSGEDLLDEHGSPQERRKHQAEQRDHRRERRPEGVVPNDLSLRETFGPSRPDVVGRQHLEHRGALIASDSGHAQDRECGHGEDEMRQAIDDLPPRPVVVVLHRVDDPTSREYRKPVRED